VDGPTLPHEWSWKGHTMTTEDSNGLPIVRAGGSGRSSTRISHCSATCRTTWVVAVVILSNGSMAAIQRKQISIQPKILL
jgi:hypothetical protein